MTKLRPLPSGKPRLYRPASIKELQSVPSQTDWAVFFGAELTPEFLYLFRKLKLLLLFEPSRERLDNFLESLDPAFLAQGKLICISGDPSALPTPLYWLFPSNIAELGQPGFYYLEGFSPEYVRYVKEHLECFYYHEQIYPYEFFTPMPRPGVVAGVTFPQAKHRLENLGFLANSGVVAQLENCCAGYPALLVAAGPELSRQLQAIRNIQERCIIICANRVYSYLVENGITPDFVVILDSSLESAQDLGGIPVHPNTCLVAYSHSGVAASAIQRRYFFGSDLENYGIEGCHVSHIGSVAISMVHFARHLGCTDILFSGLSLASTEPDRDGYAATVALEKLQSWYYAVSVPWQKEPLFTTLNFLDVALWIRAYIQAYGLSVRNLSRNSLIYGENIRFDANPCIDGAKVPRPLSLAASPAPIPSSMVLRELAAARNYWREVLEQSERVRDKLKHDPSADKDFSDLLCRYDAAGITGLLRKVPGYRDAFDTPDDYLSISGYLELVAHAAAVLADTAYNSETLWKQKMCGGQG